MLNESMLLGNNKNDTFISNKSYIDNSFINKKAMLIIINIAKDLI